MGEWLAEWIDELAASGDVSTGTVVNYRWCVKLLSDRLGVRQLVELTDRDVRSALEYFGAEHVVHNGTKGLSRSTLTRLRSVPTQALDLAVKRRLCVVNVAKTLRIPKKAKATRARRSLSLDESRRVVAWLREQTEETFPFRAAVAIQVGIGCRPGEVLGLRWSDVDLQNGAVSISGALVREPRPDGVGVLVRRGGTKTPQSVRAVKLPSWALEILIGQRIAWDAAAADREILASAGLWEERDYVFPSARSHGDLYEPGTYRRGVANMASELCLGPLVPHELRHSHASLLLDQGATLEVVADRLGHSNTRVTEQAYKHKLQEVVVAGTDTAELLG